MIAKRIPSGNVSGTYAEVAEAYGLTERELREADYDFLQCEGFLDNGHECMTLDEYLTYNSRPYKDNTPWQKGDDFPE